MFLSRSSPFRRWWALSCLLLCAHLSPAPAAAQVRTPTYPTSQLSGLPWPSGMACFRHGAITPAVLAAWRGRELDVVLGWAPRESWARMLVWLNGGGLGAFVGERHRAVVLSIPLLTNDYAGRFDACVAGAFDQKFAELGRILVRRGLANAIIRLGWEANGSWFPWSVGTQKDAYKACFRRAVQAIRSQAPQVLIDWPMAEKGHLRYSVTEIYPGDDVVDIVSISFYDRFPTFTNQAVWDQHYNSTRYGGPAGLGTWLEFAKSRGKKFALGEWGVSDGVGGGFDNDFFVKKVYEFLKSNATFIAYESYYNCKNNGIYTIYPEAYNPRAAAMYRSLWSAGK